MSSKNKKGNEGGGAQGPLTFFRRVMAKVIKNFPLCNLFRNNVQGRTIPDDNICTKAL